MAWKKEQRENMELCIEVFKSRFEAYANKWVNETDDRQLFCRVYELTLIDMEYMKKVNNLSICCAMRAVWVEEVESMKETITYFIGQTKRGLDYPGDVPRLHNNPEESLNLFWQRGGGV